MFHNWGRPIRNNHGIGLISAIFIIVIIGMFGLLLSRYVMTHSVSSAEDYLWAQALYSAESSVKLRLLQEDNSGLNVTDSSIQGYVSLHTPIITDSLDRPDGIVRVVATRAGVSREVEVNYTLTIP